MEYYSALRKRKIFAICDMDIIEGIMPREISNSEKEKYCMISLTCEI